MTEQILIDGDSLTVEEAYAVAADRIRVGLAPKARERMLRTRAVVDDIVRSNSVVYGVTTGFGKLSEVAIPPDKLAQLQVNVEFYEGKPISVELPASIDMTVVETEPGLKGATVSNVTKPAKMETGLVVQVPAFITEGEKIRVNTAEGTYQERA